MNLNDLLEAEGKQLVIIYPGRFHPFHIGHGKVYKYLKQKYSNAKVFISTSGKTDGDRSPFTFEEKKKMMMLAGVDSSVIVQSKSPYRSPEITEMFDPDKIVVVFAVSEKDMENDPRFDFSNGVNYKKNGEPAHFQKWEGMESADTVRKHSYIATTPTFPFTIRGTEINSASQIRNMISKSDDTELSQILQDLYNVADIPQDVMDIFKRKIGNSTMNENWNEDLTSAFLIEDNTMKTGILTTITEGKSPHKKGTKKYKAHMAAMHAESFDEEFDAKVKQVVESKLKNVAADIKDYVDDHKDHFDAYPMDVEVNGKVYDFDDYWKILDKVYPTAYDNHYAVEGKEQLEEAFFLAPWILPALATAVRIGAPALKLLLKGGKKAAPKVKDTTTNMIQKSTASGVIVGAVGKTVYDKVGDAIDGIKNIFGIDMDEDTLNIFAQIVVKYGIPMAAIGAVLYGGKQLKDYMTGEEEKQTGNTTINNYYNGEPVTEASIDDLPQKVKDWLNDYPAGEGEYAFAKGIPNTEANNKIINSIAKIVPIRRRYRAKSKPGYDRPRQYAHKDHADTIALYVKEKVEEGSYANEQHEQLEYIHHVLQECGDGNMDITMVEQALEYVEDIREQHFNADGSTKSESVNEGKDYNLMAQRKTMNLSDQAIIALVASLYKQLDAKESIDESKVEGVDNDNTRDIAIRCVDEMVKEGLIANDMDTDGDTEFQIQDIIHDQINKALQVRESQGHQDLGNIVGYLDTIDEYVEQLFKLAPELGMEGATAKTIAHRIQNAVDDIRSRELELEPSLIRTKYESVTEATHSDAKPIYDLVGSLGAGKIELANNPIFHNLVRFLDADTIEKFVADFRKKLDNGESIEEEQVDEWVQDQDWSESVKWAEKELGRKITNEEKEELKEIFWLPALAGAASRIPASTYAGAITGAGHFAGKAKNWIKKKLKLNNSRFEEDHKVDEWVQDQDAGNWSMWTAQERSFIQELCLRHDGVERDPAGLKYLGKSELWDEGNILKDKGKLTTLMLWVKKNKDDIEGRFTRMFKVYSKDNNNGQSDGNQVLQNIIGKIGKVDGVTEDTLDVTPKGYGPDDYDEKDVAPEAHGGDLEKMQDAYKYNEDRNNHSENILMLAQAFGDRGEIRAVEGLLKIIKRQGYTTPEQSDMMYKAIHKKYYSQLFPTETEGNEFSGELAKAKIDGKKEFKVDGKTYKVKEALSKLLDSQKTNEAGIMHYSDAKGTPEYKEGQKAAKNGEPYDSNPYSGAEKLKWSKGHNEWRHANKRKKGKPNFGARGQFEGK